MRSGRIVFLALGAVLNCTLAWSNPNLGPDVGGHWEAPVLWPMIPVSAANLPDGRIIAWASNERTTFPAGPEFTYTAVWDPDSNTFTEIPHPNHDMFCAHLVTLEDGKIFVSGGRNQGNSPWTSTFDPLTNQWEQLPNMNRGRWYPTSVALADGKVFTMIGSGGGNTGELWDGAGQWDLLGGMNFDGPILNYSHGERNWWPLLNLMPDGRIFHSGPTPEMHIIDTAGIGSVTPVDRQVTGWYPKHGTTVMYDEGMLLSAGGWVDGNTTTSTNQAMVIDLNGPAPEIRAIAPMLFPRKFQNGVTLPTGEVLVIGGNTSGAKFSDSGSVYAAEVWDPVTENWTELADMSVPRNYHSVALLTTKGLVWSAGGGLCGCAADHQDHQMFTPPKLLNADGSMKPRPVIHTAPGVVEAGQTITVRGSAGMQRFTMVKMSSTTHAVNTDLRFLDVPFSEQSAGVYALTLHDNINVLTPGHWMLFMLDENDVWSVAKVMRISTQGLETGPPDIKAMGNITQIEGDKVTLILTVSEPDGDVLTYSATGLPPGVSLNPQSGELSGSLSQTGDFAVSITVDDGINGSDSTSFTWRVLDATAAPGVAYEYFEASFDALPDFNSLVPVKTGVTSNFGLSEANVSDYFAFRFNGRIQIDTAGAYTFYTNSDDGSQLLIDGLLVVDNDGLHAPAEANGSVNLTPGLHDIEVTFFEKTGGAVLTVSYEGPGIARQPIPNGLLVVPAAVGNIPPMVANPGSQSDVVGVPANLAISAFDDNGDTLTFSATGLPPGLAIDANSGAISGTPSAVGSYTVTIDVDDGAISAGTTFSWTILDSTTGVVVFNDFSDVSGLTLNGNATTAGGVLRLTANTGNQVGSAYLTAPFALGPDTSFSTRFQFRVHGTANGADGMTFVLQGNAPTALGAAGGGLGYAGVGTSVAVEIDNYTNGWDTNANHIAVLSNGVIDNQIAEFQPGFDLEDGASHTLWVDYDGSTNRLEIYLAQGTGLKPANAVITQTMDIPALVGGTAFAGFSGGTGGLTNNHDVENWTLSVTDAVSNQSPNVTNPGDQNNTIGDTVDFTVNASDPDGDPVTFTSVGLPVGLNMDPAGRITGMVSSAGAHAVQIDVSDGIEVASVNFIWNVFLPPNTVPNITSPGDLENTVGDIVDLVIGASDADGDMLTFSATGLPGGLGIDSSSGQLSGALDAAGAFAVRIDVSDGSDVATASFTWNVYAANVAPVITTPADQTNAQNDTVNLAIIATDGNGDALTFSATGLPAGLAIDSATGVISGTLTTTGISNVSVSVSDGLVSDLATFSWNVSQPIVPLVIAPLISPPHEVEQTLNLSASAVGTGTLEFRWSWGDGEVDDFAVSPTGSHVYHDPGRYLLTLTVRDDLGEKSLVVAQAIYGVPTANPPTSDSTLIIETVTGQERTWNVNPDNDSVTVIEVNSLSKIDEIGVGEQPQSLALGADGRIWVTNKGSSSITRIDASTGTVIDTLALPRGSAPHGIVFDPAGIDAYVVLEGLGKLVKLDGVSGATLAMLDVGPYPRHLSVTGDGSRLYLARNITLPLLGEETATPSLVDGNGNPAGGVVMHVDTLTMQIVGTTVLEHSNAPVSEHSAPGLPNYLRSPVISPDGASAWVPSKQDNILRGALRNGVGLDHDHTVRAIASRIDLLTGDALVSERNDFDNASIASAAAFGKYGSYLFVALEGNRMVAAMDAYRGEELFRFVTGRAPEGLVMAADGHTLFVHNFMDRSVTAHDLSALVDEGVNAESTLATISTVDNESLSAEVLLGKQHFYDALDPRLALESYMACAACHNDGGHDGRTWDFTGFGEGLRNTASLQSAGDDEALHWTGNFDEVQDFEGQIRTFGALGLMADADFNAGTRSASMGDPKAGLSTDLDALAAYVTSLNEGDSPHRLADGSLTPEGEIGKALFEANDCASCHGGEAFTDSAVDVRHDIGTIKATSGNRLGGVLDGFDAPTLRGLWATAPYLHDGSAATLEAAIEAHDVVNLSSSEEQSIALYLAQIDASEAAPAAQVPSLESIIVSGVSSAGWTDVTLASSYTNPVVVCTVQSASNSVPQVVRVRISAANGFEVRLQNPSGSALSGETIYCMAMEAGAWRLPDGRSIEAQTYSSSVVDRQGKWNGETQSYLGSYTSPVVVGQVMSYNDARWSNFWSSGSRQSLAPNAAYLSTGLMIGEDPDISRASETVGYIVIEAGSGTANGVTYEASLGGDSIKGYSNSSKGYTYNFVQSYTGQQVLVASQAAMDGGNGGWAVIRGANGLGANSVSFSIDEDQVKDSERSHVTEQVAYFVIDQPTVVALTPQ